MTPSAAAAGAVEGAVGGEAPTQGGVPIREQVSKARAIESPVLTEDRAAGRSRRHRSRAAEAVI